MVENHPNRNKSVQPPGSEYMDSTPYRERFIENIGPSVRYFIETQKEILSEINMPSGAKNELNGINNSLSPHIPNRNIFVLLADFIPHTSLNM